MFEILRAKLRKIERRTKQIHLFFMPRRSNFAHLLAKLRKYLDFSSFFSNFAI